MGYQPIRRWFCAELNTREFAAGSETYCRFGRHGEHNVACGWKVIIDADSYFGVVPRTQTTEDSVKHQFYFSASDLRDALDVLGPPGDRAEATIKAAALSFADILEDDSKWEVVIAADLAAAVEACLPRVTVVKLK